MESTNQTHTEGAVAKSIEQHTAIAVRLFSLGGSQLDCNVLDAAMSGKAQASTFVGQWASTLVILGLYNKLVKQLGSDHTSRAVGCHE